MFLLLTYLLVLIYGLSQHVFRRQARPTLFSKLAVLSLSFLLTFAAQDASHTFGTWEDISSYIKNIAPPFSVQQEALDPAFHVTLSFLQLFLDPATIFLFALPALSLSLLLLSFAFLPSHQYRHESLFFLLLLLLPTQPIQELLFSFMRFGNASALSILSLTLLFSLGTIRKLILSLFFASYAIYSHVGITVPYLLFAAVFCIFYIASCITNYRPNLAFASMIFLLFLMISIPLRILLTDPNLLIISLSTLFPIRASNYITALQADTLIFRNFDIAYTLLTLLCFLLALASAPLLKTYSYLLSLSALALSLFLFLLVTSPLSTSYPVICRYIPLSQLLLILSLSNRHLLPTIPRQYLSVALSFLLLSQSIAFLI
jgi:hypothetical protein